MVLDGSRAEAIQAEPFYIILILYNMDARIPSPREVEGRHPAICIRRA
jgi:hypothetical protein